MKFSEMLNDYLNRLNCTAGELSSVSGLSPTTVSRYRNGERVPELDSEAFKKLCSALASLAEKNNVSDITEQSVKERFCDCSDVVSVSKEQLMQNFNTLISVLNININRLCRYTNYDASTVFRFRNGTRRPAEPFRFAAGVAGYVTEELDGAPELNALTELLDCKAEEIADPQKRFAKIQSWLISGQSVRADSISQFLDKLNEFDLNQYIKAIHFDELKVPHVPFRLPINKKYFGLKQMQDSELDFLKATVLSKSSDDVIMYSDMPMEEMAKDPEFPKKWMFGMAMMLKKGLHLHQIHNLDRSFEDVMLGLESWIPMYMTGQISPYYLKGVQNNVFSHLLKVSGTAALSGEAISGHHADGKYYLTTQKDEVAYYNRRARELLGSAQSLMDIYREDNATALKAFWAADSHTPGKRRNILSAPPIYTMDKDYLREFLQRHDLSEEVRQRILNYADLQRQIAEKILETDGIEDEIPQPSREEFERHPMTLSLSGMFYESDIPYTYEDYLSHLEQTERFADRHERYTLKFNSARTFRNLQVFMHLGSWVMVSKNKSPAIHFVIHHPKLRHAIENFIPPVVEE